MIKKKHWICGETGKCRPIDKNKISQNKLQKIYTNTRIRRWLLSRIRNMFKDLK